MVSMRTKPVLIVLLILVLGPIATLVSGFYEQNLSKPGLSKIGYGFPLVWHGHSRIVYPTTPTVYWSSSESFLLDTAFWCLIFTSIVLVWLKLIKIRFFHKS
jgi:hypothetical protein